MKIKVLFAAVACLAILSAIVAWINRPAPPPPADPRVGGALLDPAVAARAARLRFGDQGKSVALTRRADGTWAVDGYFGLPVDFDKLSRFIGDLTGAKIQRLVTANPELLARFEFKDTKIELDDAAGTAIWSLDLGKTADPSGRFVRFGSEHSVYLANLDTWLDTEPKNWADAQLLSLKPDDVAKVEISFDRGGAVTVARTARNAPWASEQAPAGQRVSADKVGSLLSSLTALRFSDTSDLNDPQAAAARAHERVFNLTMFDGTRVTAALGRKPEEKKAQPPAAPAVPVYAFISSSDARAPINALMRRRAFQIDDYVFTGLPQKPDDLFEPIPPAQATPANNK
jgi:Domain of unknown function (DUF4340)